MDKPRFGPDCTSNCIVTFSSQSLTGQLLLKAENFYLNEDDDDLTYNKFVQTICCSSYVKQFASNTKFGPTISPPLCQYQQPKMLYYIAGTGLTIELNVKENTRELYELYRL